MDNEVQRDMTTSIKLFDNILWPAIKKDKIFIESSIINVEGVRNEIAEHLDMICGFDAIIKTRKGLIGLAIRIQANDNDTNLRTFTIRLARSGNEETEYIKRIRAIKSNIYIYPALTYQAYFDGLNLLGYGVAYTKDIIESINENTIVRENDNAFFYVVNYNDIKLITEWDISLI